jgi:2-dehydro-3-deoxyphosphogluconate aldolase/(4S)-4-hydroxy-2-oxoglutarate aldolase
MLNTAIDAVRSSSSPPADRSAGPAGAASGIPSSRIATASDIMRGMQHGLDRFKFFPAEANGGLASLKALSGPFADARFCPTGGIRPDTAPQWLAHASVLCVGGSWLLPPGERDMDAVTARARAAAALPSSA